MFSRRDGVLPKFVFHFFFHAGVLLLALPAAAPGGVVTLSNGMQIEGRIGKIARIKENPLEAVVGGGEVKVKQIVIVDDDLRRVFVSSYQVPTPATVSSEVRETVIEIDQRVARSGRRVAAVAGIIRITPFDEYGRRTVHLSTADGPIAVVQGITEISPRYTKVEGLLTDTPFIWDMRIATSSIPRDVLSAVILRQIDRKNPEQRLDLVKLYLEAERYRDARAELQQVIRDFPELAELRDQVRALTQLSAQRFIDEIKQRRGAGQHELAFAMVSHFPAEGVAGETLLEVREIRDDSLARRQQVERVHSLMERDLGLLEDAAARDAARLVQGEIKTELGLNTLDRMADYLRLADDDALTTDRKLALAISGWLLGSGSGIDNLAVALSLYEVRNLVRRYFQADRPSVRDEVLAALETEEGGTPGYLAKIIANMKPPIDTEQQEGKVPGYYELKTPGLSGEPDITYYVQLPPEYDPYRKYPCVVSLNGSGTTPEQQIDWWAGTYEESVKQRLGQASRQGYIVVAPVWAPDHQTKYGYTAREHAAVLYSLRDVCRRFSVHTDKVFLHGHSMGGDAAWDIGLAHPDLWAGVLPFVAGSDKYIPHYYENAQLVPMYFVGGELDGDRMDQNALSFDRYLTKTGYDVMIVEYQGRGHEHFSDEILRVFEWMGRHERKFFPDEFSCSTMRPWDNYFFWLELSEIPEASIVAPVSWPNRGARAYSVTGKTMSGDRQGVIVSPRGAKGTIWLSPEMIDFDQRVSVNGRSREINPSAQTLLEDVRTRGDRLHPFWAKTEL